MRVMDELPPPNRKPAKDWWAIAKQLRAHAGKWVEVDTDAPRSQAWRINRSGEGLPTALAEDDAYRYEAQNRNIDYDNNRATLYVRAVKKEEE